MSISPISKKTSIENELYIAEYDSKKIMKRYKDENVFKSSTMKELASDTFQYKGESPNIVLLKDAKTGKPVEAIVDISVTKTPNKKNIWTETIELLDKENNRIGTKSYQIEKLKNGKYQMIDGSMWNLNNQYHGVGLRLDQIQIERAMQLKIKKISRTSVARSILYHTKAGFLPSEDLVKVKSLKEAAEVLEKEACGHLSGDYVPIIKRKGSEFFVDVNASISNGNLNIGKRILEYTKSRHVSMLEAGSTMLELAGNEINKWNKIIQSNPILSKLTVKLPK